MMFTTFIFFSLCMNAAEQSEHQKRIAAMRKRRNSICAQRRGKIFKNNPRTYVDAYSKSVAFQVGDWKRLRKFNKLV